MKKVFAKKCFTYDKEKIKKLFNEIFLSDKFDEKLKSINSILLKPNLLGAFAAERAVTSHPIFIAALIEILQDYQISISLFDNPGGNAKFQDVIEKTGMKPLAEKYNITILQPGSEIQKFGSDPEYIISKHFLDFQGFINLSKMKTHSYTLFTGAIKNTYGIVPGLAKANYHKLAPNPVNFSHFIVDIYDIIKDKILFNLMDGIYGMDGDGPSRGKAKNFGVILGGKNAIALDFCASRMMGYEASKIPIIKIAAQSSNLNLNDIKLEGNFDENYHLPDVNIKTSKRMNILLRTLSNPVKGLIHKFLWAIPEFDPEKCTKCGECVNFCPASALKITSDSPVPQLNSKKCLLCLCCLEICSQNAVK